MCVTTRSRQTWQFGVATELSVDWGAFSFLIKTDLRDMEGYMEALHKAESLELEPIPPPESGYWPEQDGSWLVCLVPACNHPTFAREDWF